MAKRSKWAAPRWRRYTKFMRRIHPWCSNCRTRDNLSTHHLKYPPKPLPIWVIPPWYLMVLCDPCHARVTKRHRSGKMNHYQATVDMMGPKFYVWRTLNITFWTIVFLPFVILAIATLYAALMVGLV